MVSSARMMWSKAVPFSICLKLCTFSRIADLGCATAITTRALRSGSVLWSCHTDWPSFFVVSVEKGWHGKEAV
eukprot:458714-Heterocapsa_arctica.AAC.1